MSKQRKNIDLDTEVVEALAIKAIQSGTVFKPYAEQILTEHSKVDLLKCKELLEAILTAPSADSHQSALKQAKELLK